MSISRLDFIKLVGISIASLVLTRCSGGDSPTPILTCYVTYIPLDDFPTPTPKSLTVLDRLRLCWMSFGELAHATIRESNPGSTNDKFGEALITEHRTALDEVVASGELASSVADLIQEAYEAAVYHVWRSNTLITCYEAFMVDYSPASAQVLVQQAELLQEIAAQATIAPETLAKAQSALEHDLAFYALTDEEVSALYERILSEWQSQGQNIPAFDDLELVITPDVKTAARFIIDLLAGE
ncbi:MAG: hypothetical protein AB1531_05890 [Chloroflexota bacterium]